MKTANNGHGTLRRNGDVTELKMVGAAAEPAQERGTPVVRVVIIERMPGGPELEVNLSADDAARFASTVYELARTAIIKNEGEASHPGAPGL